MRSDGKASGGGRGHEGKGQRRVNDLSRSGEDCNGIDSRGWNENPVSCSDALRAELREVVASTVTALTPADVIVDRKTESTAKHGPPRHCLVRDTSSLSHMPIGHSTCA